MKNKELTDPPTDAEELALRESVNDDAMTDILLRLIYERDALRAKVKTLTKSGDAGIERTGR